MKESSILSWREMEHNQDMKREDSRPEGRVGEREKGEGELLLVEGSSKRWGTFPQTWSPEDVRKALGKCWDSTDSQTPAEGDVAQVAEEDSPHRTVRVMKREHMHKGTYKFNGDK